MSSKSKFSKIVIILILVVFLLITALSAIVPYIWKTNTPSGETGDVLSGDTAVVTGTVDVATWTDLSGSAK